MKAPIFKSNVNFVMFLWTKRQLGFGEQQLRLPASALLTPRGQSSQEQFSLLLAMKLGKSKISKSILDLTNIELKVRNSTFNF